MLAVIGALSEELKGVRRLMTVESVRSFGRASVFQGSLRDMSLLLVKSGVGKQRAQNACRFVLEHYPVTSIVSLGFGGALDPGLKAGELIVCSHLSCSEPEEGSCACDEHMLSLAMGTAGSWHRGRGVTSLAVAATEDRKRHLGETYSADVVDMESYFVAKEAAENHIPFIAARAVSDTVNDPLPELPSWQWKHVVPYFAAHPELGFDLYRNLLKARQNLTEFVCRFVELGC